MRSVIGGFLVACATSPAFEAKLRDGATVAQRLAEQPKAAKLLAQVEKLF